MHCTRWLTLVFALCLPATAWADSEASARDYSLLLAGGAFLFVMLAPGEPWNIVDPELRRRYRASGLYLVGSDTPRWIVDWYELFALSSCGAAEIDWRVVHQ